MAWGCPGVTTLLSLSPLFTRAALLWLFGKRLVEGFHEGHNELDMPGPFFLPFSLFLLHLDSHSLDKMRKVVEAVDGLGVTE